MSPEDRYRLAVDALKGYACDGLYFGVAVWGDPPTGGFDKDMSHSESLDRLVPGATARRALAELDEEWDDEVIAQDNRAWFPDTETP